MAFERTEGSRPARPMRRGRKKVCSFCVDRIDTIDYKDVPRLRKYVSERAKIRIISEILRSAPFFYGTPPVGPFRCDRYRGVRVPDFAGDTLCRPGRRVRRGDPL